jgi:hypothetical protein
VARAWSSPDCIAKVNNARSCTSTFPYAFMALCLINFRDKLATLLYLLKLPFFTAILCKCRKSTRIFRFMLYQFAALLVKSLALTCLYICNEARK